MRSVCKELIVYLLETLLSATHTRPSSLCFTFSGNCIILCGDIFFTLRWAELINVLGLQNWLGLSSILIFSFSLITVTCLCKSHSPHCFLHAQCSSCLAVLQRLWPFFTHFMKIICQIKIDYFVEHKLRYFFVYIMKVNGA